MTAHRNVGSIVLATCCAGALVLLCVASTAALTGEEVLNKCIAAARAIHDYTCTITVTVDFPNARVPKRTFTLYVKKPDKVRVESHGQLVVVPKDVLLFGNLEKHLRNKSHVVLAGHNTNNGRPVYFVKILSEEPDTDDKLLLWIWGDRWNVKRSELWRGESKLLSVDWTYMPVGKYWLPKRVVCHITGGRMVSEGPGTITAVFSNWRVNTGLPDRIFADQKSSPK